MAKKGARVRLAKNNGRLATLGGLLVVSIAAFALLRLVRKAATARPIHYASLLLGGGLGASCLAALKLHAAPTYLASGELEDGGADLSVPGGFLSTLHDGVYLACTALLVGCVRDWGLALLGAFPAYGVAKLWGGVVAPLLAAARGGGGGAAAAAGGPSAAPGKEAAEAKKARKAARQQQRAGGGRR